MVFISTSALAGFLGFLLSDLCLDDTDIPVQIHGYIREGVERILNWDTFSLIGDKALSGEEIYTHVVLSPELRT